jgi:hypothetical protein
LHLARTPSSAIADALDLELQIIDHILQKNQLKEEEKKEEEKSDARISQEKLENILASRL